jgi:hypothetical protein
MKVMAQWSRTVQRPMAIYLWHFTHSPAVARQIQAEGFRDNSSHEYGLRWPCFSLPWERKWEKTWGPALVVVWLEFDEEELAGYEQGGRGAAAGSGSIISYQIPPDILKIHTVKRRAYDNVDQVTRTSEADPEGP